MEPDMDFIKIYFEEYRSVFLLRLNNVNIVGDLAKQFLPETAKSILYTIKNTRLEKTIEILLSDNPSKLLDLIDIDALASALCISTEQVDLGLKAIAPVMSQIFILNSNEIVAATASLAWSSLDDDKDSAVNF